MMNRRNFLSIGLGVVAAAVIPTGLSAVDFRTTKPKAWSNLSPMKGGKVDAKDMSGIDNSMKELYGTSTTIDGTGKIKLKAPQIAENGAIIPLTISSKLNATSVAIFQSANPEATVAVFTVPPGGIVYYSLRIKMAQTAEIRVVVETDGKLYSVSKEVKVTKGGCGG